MKELKAPEGKVFDKEALKDGRIVFIDEPKPMKVYKTLDELPQRDRWYVDILGKVCSGDDSPFDIDDLPTKKMAEAVKAQLLLLKFVYFANGEQYVPGDYDRRRAVITPLDGEIGVYTGNGHSWLSFYKAAIAREFLNTHRELIEKALPLL